MSRLIEVTPEVQNEPEPEGYEYGYAVFEELEPIQTNKLATSEINDIKVKDDPIPEDTQVAWDIQIDQLKKLQKKNKFCKNIFNNLNKYKKTQGKPYYIEEGLLKRYTVDNKQRFEVTVVPPECATILLNLAHDQLGHNGSARTYMLLKRSYYWKGMKPDIFKYVKQCPVCQEVNVQPVKYAKLHYDAPTTPMEFISMDLIGEFHPPSEKGNKYALTVICMLTGYTFCVPLKTKTASEVVKAYIDNVYSKFGGSLKMLSDNGTEFKNELFTEVATELGVEYKIYSPPYHPQSNGKIEGFHHFLKACMTKHISDKLEWDDVIPLACAAYNFLPNEHSKESPFFLMFGREARIPLKNMFQPKVRYLGNDENILSLESLKKMYQLVAENLKLARERRDPKLNDPHHNLVPGDSIMIKTHTGKPLEPIYKGNYRIVSIKGNQVEVMPAQGGKSHMVHITDVKYVLPAESIIKHLPNYNMFGRKTTLNFNPDKITDLGWQLATTLNTKVTDTTHYTSATPQTVVTSIYTTPRVNI